MNVFLVIGDTEESSLFLSESLQFVRIVRCTRLLLQLSLVFALCLIAHFLLSCLLFLPLCKARSSSHSPSHFLLQCFVPGSMERGNEDLPAWLPWLTGMPTIIIAATTATAAETTSSATAAGLRLRFVYFQSSAANLCAI